VGLAATVKLSPVGKLNNAGNEVLHQGGASFGPNPLQAPFTPSWPVFTAPLNFHFQHSTFKQIL
jgi:hypothetical protein